MTPAEAVADHNQRRILARPPQPYRFAGGGKQADIAVFEVEDYREFPTNFGVKHLAG